MMTHQPSHQPHFDVIIVGAGHAGCEAALAAARAGCTTLIVTPNLDRAGYMPCNPSIGGPGKSHIVAEVDALGGEMARCADRTALQVRRLNTSKGPAVQAIRSQQDKGLYALSMKEALEQQPGLRLLQDEVMAIDLLPDRDGGSRVQGVQTRALGSVQCGAVVITAGTFLRGAMVAGESRASGGRAGDRADNELASSLSTAGFLLRRLKTGTPPRIDAASVDFTAAEEQPGEREPCWLSRDGEMGNLELLYLPSLPVHRKTDPGSDWRPQLSCFKIATNEATHAIIHANLDRAPMFNGGIEGVGPRYCPSIEDKVARFTDKNSHPVFLEPEGWRTTELYVQGMSTSLPFDVQVEALKTIPALRNVEVSRFGYAVEYDAVDPAELSTSMESRRCRGLFLAGQVNGTSGYEEAAGQGILAGLNAANCVQGRPSVVFGRDQAYIGVMVDDLATKPFDEPYRMLTSRAEYRLLLRPDTAHDRLGRIAYDHGLIGQERYNAIVADRLLLDRAMDHLSQIRFNQSDHHSQVLSGEGIVPVTQSMTLAEILRRPATSLADVEQVAQHDGKQVLADLPRRLWPRLEQEIKYGAFIEREAREAAKHAALEHRELPARLSYEQIAGLRIEAQTKLQRHQPRTFGEASRIAGVTPSDIAALLVHTVRRPEA